MPKLGYAIIQLFTGVVLFTFFYRYFRGKYIPYVTDERSALIALIVVGFIVCTIGILSNLPTMKWGNFFIIVAAVLGSVIIFFGILSIFNIELFSFLNYKSAFYILMGLIIAKWVFASIHHLAF